jgi:hypothetical protein
MAFLGKVMILFASAVFAQELPLQPVVQGGLAPGVTQVYTLQANAGDLIIGTVEQRGCEGGMVTLYDWGGLKLKQEPFYDNPGPQFIGLIAPKKGDYRIQITATGTRAGSYTLRIKKQTPSERMKGRPK